MKTKLGIVFLLGALLAAGPVMAQGKGGGGGGGRGGGGGGSPGNGFGHGASGGSRAADALPSDRPGKPERGRDAEAPKPGARAAKPAAQELAGAMHEINQTAFAQRKQLHETLDMRLKSSREALKQVQADAKDLRGAARDEFKASLDAVKTRERELDRALKATRKSTEASWERDRGALDRAYRNFHDAVTKLEALPRPPRPPVPPLP